MDQQSVLTRTLETTSSVIFIWVNDLLLTQANHPRWTTELFVPCSMQGPSLIEPTQQLQSVNGVYVTDVTY